MKMSDATGLRRGLRKASPFTIANMAVRREQANKDMIVVVVGDRGSGKSTLGIKIIDSYLNIKKELGLIDSISWKSNFKEHYAISTFDAIRMYRELEEGSFLVIDEGGDVAYSGDAMTRLSKALVKLVAKIREKRLFTVICLPYKEMLSKKLLKMTHNLIVVPYRFEKKWAYAMVYSKSGNIFLEGDGYGIDKMKKLLETGLKYDDVMVKRQALYQGNYITEIYPKYLFRKLMKIPSFKFMFRFKDVNEDIRDMYYKYVKSKLINSQDSFGLVPQAEYDQLKWRYETLLYNLYTKGNMKKKELERAHIDKFGNTLMSSHKISGILDRVCGIEQAPEVEDD